MMWTPHTCTLQCLSGTAGDECAPKHATTSTQSLRGLPDDTATWGGPHQESSDNQWRWGIIQDGRCHLGDFVYLRTCACGAAAMITGVMIVVIHGHCAQPAVSFNYRCLRLQILTQSVQPPPDSLLTVKRKSIHIRFSLCLSSPNSMTGRGGQFHVMTRGSSGPLCVGWPSSLHILKDTQMSLEVRMSNSSFEVQVVRLWCAAAELERHRRVGPEWQVCLGELTDLSMVEICLL